VNTFFYFCHNKINCFGGDFVAEVREPIYMKWWAWIAIFLLTAVIVNHNTKDIPPYEETIVDILPSEDLYEEALLAMTMIDEDESESLDDAICYDAPVTFLIGTEIPEGEYFVMSQTGKFGYVLLTRSKNLNVHEIIWQKHFENHTIVSLRAGVYLTTKNTTLIPIDDAIIPNFENSKLHSGTYRVGIDIPPGVYTLFPLENKIGYFSTATSSHYLEAHTVQRRNFSEPITIAINIGDYFTLMRAEIRK